MVSFFVNGKEVCAEEKTTLLRFLRDELHLTSAKDGCSEGACGTCTVLIDGVATRACTRRCEKLAGKRVLTLEGLDEAEQRIYTYAFGEAGAVQCGFCIPGMIMAAKGLLDVNPDPTEDEVRHAIRFNICRCTGYVKIVRAILLAAKLLREGICPDESTDWRLGARVHRIDVFDKTTGRGIYPDDIHIDGMLHAVAVRSQYPRARVLSVDTSEALALDGVVAVLTADDIPGKNKVGHLVKDWDTLIGVGGITHFLGDAVAIVAAKTRRIAEAAQALVKVEYEELPFVDSPEAAMREDAPLVHAGGNLLTHKHIARGDASGAIKKSKYVLHERFSTPWTEHAFLEPECAVAVPEGNGVHIYSTDQGVYDTQHETAPMLGLPMEEVRVENCYVGGGFGGKEDVTVQHLAALVAYVTKQPCKMKLTRKESLLFHPKRHPMQMEFTIGCDENGIIQGVKANVIADTGAYASLGGPVLERACTHASGPYHYENFEIDGYAYYTNNPPAGAFRGFGVTQTCFAIETLLNEMAEKIGISTWEIRYRNAIRPHEVLPNGQIVDESTGLVETLNAIKPYYDAAKVKGIACAMKNAGVGVGLPDTGRVKLTVLNGNLTVHCAGSCIGQGVGTVLKQIVFETTGIDPDHIKVEASNTFNAPDSGTTSGSRHTTISGEAALRAAKLFNEARNGRTLAEMDGEEYYAEYLAKTDKLGANVKNPVSHVAYGYATQLCVLDPETGKIEKIVAAHDVGRAVNPTSVEGQIEGGVIMSCGFALRERYPLKDCKPTATFGTLGLFRADEVPFVEPLIVEKPGLGLAYGAIGIGEITSIPTAPAIADAYCHLSGIRERELPLVNTPYARKTK